MAKVLVTIQYVVEKSKREAYLNYAREMREHAVGLGLDLLILEDSDHEGAFIELHSCASQEDYEALDEKQDDTFRDFVARLERFTASGTTDSRALGTRTDTHALAAARAFDLQ